MAYKLKTDSETRAYVQLLMNFKGVRTENIFNKTNISRSSLYPIVKAQTVTDKGKDWHVVGIVTGRPRKYGALVRSGLQCVEYRNYGKVKVNSWPIQ